MAPLTTQLPEQFGFSVLLAVTHTVFNQSPRPFDSMCLIFFESPHFFPSPFWPPVYHIGLVISSLHTHFFYSFISIPLLPKTFSGLSPAENPAKAPNSLRIKPRNLNTKPLLSLNLSRLIHCSALHSTPSSRMNLCSLSSSCCGYFGKRARRRQRSQK